MAVGRLRKLALTTLAGGLCAVGAVAGPAAGGTTVALVPGPPAGDPPVTEDADNNDSNLGGGFFPRAGGTHWVNVKIVVDQAFKDKYSNWEDKARNAVERADNKMADEFGIDFLIREVGSWSSKPGGSTCTEQHDDLGDVGFNGRDLIFGFTGKNVPDAAGCAPILGRRAVIEGHANQYQWIIVRHEASHLFGAKDRYINGELGTNPNHLDDVMEDPYDHPNRWSDEAGDGDWQIIVAHNGRFD